VHGSVLTVVGQNSLPISTAIRSLRQNSSSCSRRRAVASNVPSSKTRLIMVPPNRVGYAVTRRFESSARGKFLCFECLYSPRTQLHPAMWAFLGLAEGEIPTGREFGKQPGRLLTLVPCKISLATTRALRSRGECGRHFREALIRSQVAGTPKLLAEMGDGTIPPWDVIVVSSRHQTCSRPRRSETLLHRQ
jgi:hypothetical protein